MDWYFHVVLPDAGNLNNFLESPDLQIYNITIKIVSGEVNRIWKTKQKKTLFPTPVLRPMTAATVGIVSAPPVMSRNSATAAVPARIFQRKKNPAADTKAHIVINPKTGTVLLA